MSAVAAAVRAAAEPGVGPGCEAPGDGWLVEPVAAWTSLAFVVAGLVVAAGARAGRGPDGRTRLTYAALVAGVGVGSFVQHGPDPVWSDVAHDLPLVATLAFLAADAVAHLAGRPRRWWWWAAPTAALVAVVVAAPRAGDLAQVGAAVVAIGAWALRGWRTPADRWRIGVGLGLLAVGGPVGRLGGRGGPLCDPDSPWQTHGLWHVLAAVALAVLAPLVTAPGRTDARDGSSRASGAGFSGRTRP